MARTIFEVLMAFLKNMKMVLWRKITEIIGSIGIILDVEKLKSVMKDPLFIIVTILACFFCTHLSAKNKSKAEIHWSEQKLSWNDFKAPAPNNQNGALTASSIYFGYRCNADSMFYEINAVFIPNESWVNAYSKNPYILDHEQLHFDITELYARKIRKALSESNFTCEEKYQMEDICRQLIEEWDQIQRQYDEETQHSQNQAAQLEWTTFIRKSLQEYAEWVKN